MFDDFFIRALMAGVGIAIVTGPIGCFVVWRRLAYYGDTLAHSGLLGVTLGYVLGLNMSFTVFAISAIVAFLLHKLHHRLMSYCRCRVHQFSRTVRGTGSDDWSLDCLHWF